MKHTIYISIKFPLSEKPWLLKDVSTIHPVLVDLPLYLYECVFKRDDLLKRGTSAKTSRFAAIELGTVVESFPRQRASSHRGGNTNSEWNYGSILANHGKIRQ